MDATTVEGENKKQTSSTWTFLTELVQIGFVIAFVCYATGYIIWHSYLGQYGFSPAIGLWQVEFLSAAFCYFLLFVSFAAPPALLFFSFVRRRQLQKQTFVAFVIVWTYILLRVESLYFPGQSAATNQRLIALAIVAGIGASQLLLVFALRRKFPTSKMRLAFAHREWFLMYPTALFAALFFIKVPTPLFFGSLATFFVTALGGLAGIDILENWRSKSFRVFFSFAISLLLLTNVREFGRDVFKFIPRSVGGGKPQLASLKFVSGRDDLRKWVSEAVTNEISTLTNALVNRTNSNWVTNISFTIVTNLPPAAKHGFVGPLLILFRSEKEIVFLDTLPHDSTNKVRAKQISAEAVEAIEFLP